MTGLSVLVDGATNFTAKVDLQRRLWTRAVTISNGLNASICGDQYIVTPPIINLTSDNESGVLYIRNNEKENISWALVQILLTMGDSTGGSGEYRVNFYANENTGTIVTAGADLIPLPLNFGSTKPLDAIAKTGAEGLVFSGSPFTDRLITGFPISIEIPLDAVVLPPGTSGGIAIIPPTGNTSMDIDVEFTIIRLSEDV